MEAGLNIPRLHEERNEALGGQVDPLRAFLSQSLQLDLPLLDYLLFGGVDLDLGFGHSPLDLPARGVGLGGLYPLGLLASLCQAGFAFPPGPLLRLGGIVLGLFDLGQDLGTGQI